MRSYLELFDLAHGQATTLMQSERHIEAPNWMAHDRGLLVNCDGRLYCVDFEQPELQPIETGFATACNNDHGLSPDGLTLAISDASVDGASAIYTLPVGGGEPRPVISRTPAYWHGWSPDGDRLAYVADRGEGFDVYTCTVDGADEQRVTRGFDHCDGPDYSADGSWIWFNGERDGTVDLWRIRPDGGALQRMTRDAEVNWFPHPSPNGDSVLYLAFPAATVGHPFGKDVALRLLPAEGGEAIELVRFCGGQGSINVPGWAPDGRRFAFVRYAS